MKKIGCKNAKSNEQKRLKNKVNLRIFFHCLQQSNMNIFLGVMATKFSMRYTLCKLKSHPNEWMAN